MLRLYHVPLCPFCRKIRIALREKALVGRNGRGPALGASRRAAAAQPRVRGAGADRRRRTWCATARRSPTISRRPIPRRRCWVRARRTGRDPAAGRLVRHQVQPRGDRAAVARANGKRWAKRGFSRSEVMREGCAEHPLPPHLHRLPLPAAQMAGRRRADPGRHHGRRHISRCSTIWATCPGTRPRVRATGTPR